MGPLGLALTIYLERIACGELLEDGIGLSHYRQRRLTRKSGCEKYGTDTDAVRESLADPPGPFLDFLQRSRATVSAQLRGSMTTRLDSCPSLGRFRYGRGSGAS